jgi:molecular chaperone GrpE (heat shock protein)
MTDARQVTDLFEEISGKLSALEHRFAPIASQASSAVDNRLKNAITPILRCIDTVEQVRSEGKEEEMLALSVVANELESILESLGIERFSLHELDVAQQHVAGTRPTDKRELHGKIAKSVRQGFRTPDRVIRAELVYLFKFEGQ